MAGYFYPEYKFSYLRTKDDVEIDLIVERPGKKILCTVKEIDHSEAICISQEPRAKKIGDVLVLPWQEALEKYFAKSLS
ncbi:MAG: hypothetical protein WCG05_01990 [Alphaproteobacteria bacterium]